MNKKQKKWYPLSALLLAFLFACSSGNRAIPQSAVTMNDQTRLVTYKENGKKVTGTIESKYRIPFMRDSILRKTTVKDGILQLSTDYYPNGKLYAETDWLTRQSRTYNPDGITLHSETCYTRDYRDSLTLVYSPEGVLLSETALNPKTGEKTEKRYSAGKQTTETITDKDGNILREYEFDDNGQKIIPNIDKLQLVATETGFYQSGSPFYGKTLWQPIIIMKWKNISGTTITESIEVKAVFIENGEEEWSTGSTYLHSEYSDAPFRSGISRQISIQSNVGYQDFGGIYNANITCQIYIDDLFYKTIKIKNKELLSNRIQ